MENLTYTKVDDYYLPDLILPPQEEYIEIGVWRQRHLRYIKQHRRVLYINLLTSCKLNSYLAEIDKHAEAMFSQLVKELTEKEGITEKLKADNQMDWVQKMNNVRNRAIEVVNVEIILK